MLHNVTHAHALAHTHTSTHTHQKKQRARQHVHQLHKWRLWWNIYMEKSQVLPQWVAFPCSLHGVESAGVGDFMGLPPRRYQYCSSKWGPWTCPMDPVEVCHLHYQRISTMTSCSNHPDSTAFLVMRRHLSVIVAGLPEDSDTIISSSTSFFSPTGWLPDSTTVFRVRKSSSKVPARLVKCMLDFGCAGSPCSPNSARAVDSDCSGTCASDSDSFGRWLIGASATKFASEFTDSKSANNRSPAQSPPARCTGSAVWEFAYLWIDALANFWQQCLYWFLPLLVLSFK